jgi:hypothetical protein
MRTNSRVRHGREFTPCLEGPKEQRAGRSTTCEGPHGGCGREILEGRGHALDVIQSFGHEDECTALGLHVAGSTATANSKKGKRDEGPGRGGSARERTPKRSPYQARLDKLPR